MSARLCIWTLAALAPVIAGCGAAKHLLPGGTRYEVARDSTRDDWLLPPDGELSCAAFAAEGSAVSPPTFQEEPEPELLPLTAPDEHDPIENDANESDSNAKWPIESERSILEAPAAAAAGFDLPAPVLVETEEESRHSLALEAASLASAPRRTSTDVTVGPLKEPIERDPPPMPARQPALPLVPPSPPTIADQGPVRADYVNAPLTKVARHLHLPHRHRGDGVAMRPGLIAGLHGRVAGHREPPEPVPFVVYEHVAPRFLPVPTRPVFEPATAVYADDVPQGTSSGISIKPPFSPPPPKAPPMRVFPGPLADDPSTVEEERRQPPPEETLPGPVPWMETLPRSLPPMEAFPLPQPEMSLPPAPHLDIF